MILQYISNTGIQYFVRVLQHALTDYPLTLLGFSNKYFVLFTGIVGLLNKLRNITLLIFQTMMLRIMELIEVHSMGLKQINAPCFTRTIKRSRATGIFLIKGLILGQRYDNIYPSHDLFEFF